MLGGGNDYILIDNRNKLFPSFSPEQIKLLCDRNLGVGGDGVIFVLNCDHADYEMKIFNSEGLQTDMHGGGLRSMAKFCQVLEQKQGQKTKYMIDTGNGVFYPTVLENGYVKISMGFAKI